MRRLTVQVCIIALLVLGFSGTLQALVPEQPVELPELVAESFLLIEANTGKALLGHNIDERMYPASTTKILTALLAIELGDLSELVTVGDEVRLIGPGSSVAGLQRGDVYTLHDLIYGLMLPSGNDAAYTIAVHLARRSVGDPNLPSRQAVELFAAMMNGRAAQLGAVNSNFVVPDGYHHPDHYSTAYDLALIAREAMKHEFLQQVVQTSRYEAAFSRSEPMTREWFNTNRLLYEEIETYFPLATGLKTGTTPQAGACLVSSGSYDGLDLIAVVLKSTREARWEDSRSLLQYGFDNYQYVEVVTSHEVVTLTQMKYFPFPRRLPALAAHGFSDVFPRNAVSRINMNVTLEADLLQPRLTGSSLILAPVMPGHSIGRVAYTLDGQPVGEIELLAGEMLPDETLWVIIGVMIIVTGLFMIHQKMRYMR